MNDAFFEKFVENSPNASAYYQMVLSENHVPIDIVFLYANTSFAEMISKCKDEFIGKKASDLFIHDKEVGKKWLRQSEKILNSGKKCEFKQYISAHDKWYKIYISQIAEHNFSIYCVDISEPVKMELKAKAELKYCLKSFQKHVENAPYGIFTCNEKGEFIYLNRTCETIFDYTKEELLKKNILDLVSPDEKEKARNIYEQAKSLGYVGYEITTINKNGEPCICNIGVMHISEDNNMCFLNDVTDKKKLHIVTRRNLKRNESLVKIIQQKTNTIDNFLDLAINEAVELTGSKLGWIVLYDENDQTFSFESETEMNIKEITKDKINKFTIDDTGVWGDVIRQRKSIIVNEYKTISSDNNIFAQQVPIKRMLVIPVIDKESIVAIIGVGNKDDAYDKDDELQLSLFFNDVWEVVDRRKTRDALKEERERIRITLLSIGEAVISTDANGKITVLNHSAEKMTGWTNNQAVNKPLNDVFIIENEINGHREEPLLFNALKTGKVFEAANHTIIISRNGNKIPISHNAAPVIDDNGNIQGGVLVFRDVTEERQRETEIEFLSYHDKLTGIFNRRYFEDALKENVAKNILPLSLIMGDLNGLKMANDAFGHDIGDKILVKSAAILNEVCQNGDIAARCGGDEFIIILPEKDEDYASRVYNEIKKRFSETKEGVITLSISLGYSTRHLPDEDVETVLRKAEDMMYRNKLFESPSMRGKAIGTIMKTLHEKIPREEQHSIRVSQICASIGGALHLPGTDVSKLATAGMLHDIGKISINERILNKMGPLTPDERTEVERHPEIGYRILSLTDEMGELADYILAHHERMDGSGYPKGLVGNSIPLFSKIIAVADVYDAMTSDRSYRMALSKDTAIKFIQSNSNILFDSAVVDAFLIVAKNL